MILLIWFVVIDDLQNDDRDTHTRVDDCTSSVHDGSGKPFAIVLSYKNSISCTGDDNSVGKKIVGDLYMMIFLNHFSCCSIIEIVYSYLQV